jgi:hypothetical protein
MDDITLYIQHSFAARTRMLKPFITFLLRHKDEP